MIIYWTYKPIVICVYIYIYRQQETNYYSLQFVKYTLYRKISHKFEIIMTAMCLEVANVSYNDHFSK
jgi:hypothetical protein